MAKNYYDTSDIIASAKRRALLPSSQNTFSDVDFLAFANEELSLGLVPSVLKVHEDYFLFTEEISLVTDVTKYTIPYRATGNKVREIAFKDNNGNIFEMTRIGVGDLPFYNGAHTYDRAYAYYIANNQICLAPKKMTNDNNVKLRVSYYIRPNTLVMPESIGVISGINRTTGELQLSNLPAAFSTHEKYDFIKVKSPHKCITIEVSPTSLNTISKTVTFAVADIPADLEVGDHLAIATESCIPQVPSDLHVVLAHRVAARCLEALGDSEGLQNANAKLAEMEQKIENVIDNRVEDAPQKVVNRHAILRRGLYSRRYRFRG